MWNHNPTLDSYCIQYTLYHLLLLYALHYTSPFPWPNFNLNRYTPSPYPYLQVPYYFNVLVKRPIGLHVEEAEDKSVVVKRLTPELGAAKTRRIEVSGWKGGQNYDCFYVYA